MLKVSLRDVLGEWLKSSNGLKAFTIGKSDTLGPNDEKWFIWYHVWAQLEIFDDRLAMVNKTWGSDFLASDPKFFTKIEKYLLYQKNQEDAWLIGRGYSLP